METEAKGVYRADGRVSSEFPTQGSYPTLPPSLVSPALAGGFFSTGEYILWV